MVDVLIFSFPHKIISIVRKRHPKVSFFVLKNKCVSRKEWL
nr:MAG TPA: hypothetical protein [Bacteriophage sp.]